MTDRDIELTQFEIEWNEQEITRETKTLELLLKRLTVVERERVRVNVTKRCLERLRKEREPC